MAHIEDCYRGFRESYLDYAALSEQLQAWAEAFPACTRLQSLGKTPEEREIWLLSIAADPKQVGPAVWVDGNMHAGEVAGSSAALAIAEAALRLHVGDKPPLELPDAQLAVLRSVTFHVCPRISPDGAEAVLREGGFVRSVPRKWREDRRDPYWLPRDIDGDGVRRFIRMPDPAGEFVESGGRSGLMLPRRIQDPPPYYRVYPEGVIENFDGHTIPEPEFLTDTTDLNRNFPWDWAPEPEQAGSGSYPGSEPESRAVLDWSSRHPELYAWLNLHTYGGVFIRPLGHERDVRMNRSDLAVVPPARGLGRGAGRLPHGERLRGVHLRAGKAAARRPHRLRLQRARLPRPRVRDLGPVSPSGARHQPEVRRRAMEIAENIIAGSWRRSAEFDDARIELSHQRRHFRLPRSTTAGPTSWSPMPTWRCTRRRPARRARSTISTPAWTRR